jgi:Ca-activated chloride channel family protein
MNRCDAESRGGIKRKRQAAACFAVCAFLGSFGISARADTAARLYEQGKFNEAMERYQKAAEKQPENWPLFYNLGAAAYKAGRPDQAAQAFERATAAQDRQLQTKALYNLGNACFRLGQATEQQSPEQALPVYEKSLHGYESALALDPNDTDAKFNGELVRKKIEELKKQQEQQQQQDKQDKQDKKDKKDKDQNKSQQKEDQAQQKPEEQKDQQAKQDQQKQDQHKQDPKSGQQQQKPQKAKQDQRPQPKPGEDKRPQDNLDRAQAAALLDNLREDERMWSFFPELMMKTNNLAEPLKDW